MSDRAQIRWGWGTVADALTWVLGAAIAVWQLAVHGSLEPGTLTFVTGCILGPVVRRSLWSRQSTDHGSGSPEK